MMSSNHTCPFINPIPIDRSSLDPVEDLVQKHLRLARAEYEVSRRSDSRQAILMTITGLDDLRKKPSPAAAGVQPVVVKLKMPAHTWHVTLCMTPEDHGRYRILNKDILDSYTVLSDMDIDLMNVMHWRNQDIPLIDEFVYQWHDEALGQLITVSIKATCMPNQ